MDDIIRRWSSSPMVLAEARRIASGEELPETTPVSLLAIRYPERFSGAKLSTLPQLLYTLAKDRLTADHVDTNELAAMFPEALREIYADHLTAMEKANALYERGDVKNADKLLSDIYCRDLDERLARAIGNAIVMSS